MLNHEYRWIDTTTDVLSFHYSDDFSSLRKTDIAWEMVLSESKISSQSEEYGNTEEEETYKLIIHSFLHILWYDHEDDKEYEDMYLLENIISSKLNDDFSINIK